MAVARGVLLDGAIRRMEARHCGGFCGRQCVYRGGGVSGVVDVEVG